MKPLQEDIDSLQKVCSWLLFSHPIFESLFSSNYFLLSIAATSKPFCSFVMGLRRSTSATCEQSSPSRMHFCYICGSLPHLPWFSSLGNGATLLAVIIGAGLGHFPTCIGSQTCLYINANTQCLMCRKSTRKCFDQHTSSHSSALLSAVIRVMARRNFNSA